MVVVVVVVMVIMVVFVVVANPLVYMSVIELLQMPAVVMHGRFMGEVFSDVMGCMGYVGHHSPDSMFAVWSG